LAPRNRSTSEYVEFSLLSLSSNTRPEYIVSPVPMKDVGLLPPPPPPPPPCPRPWVSSPLYEKATPPDPASTKYCHSAGSSNSFSTATVTRHTRRLTMLRSPRGRIQSDAS